MHATGAMQSSGNLKYRSREKSKKHYRPGVPGSTSRLVFLFFKRSCFRNMVSRRATCVVLLLRTCLSLENVHATPSLLEFAWSMQGRLRNAIMWLASLLQGSPEYGPRPIHPHRDFGSRNAVCIPRRLIASDLLR